MTPQEALVALNMLPNIGPIRVRRLLEAFGDVRQRCSARRRTG